MSNEEKKELLLRVIESALNSLREIGENYEIREIKPVNPEKEKTLWESEIPRIREDSKVKT